MNSDKAYFAKQLGNNIAKYRQRMGLTQEQLAEKVELGNEAVSRIERGIALPSIMRLAEFATVFHCEIADLLCPPQTSPQDELHYIGLLLRDLPEADRLFVIHQLESWVTHLKAKSSHKR